jgi:hypothetical protein
VRHVRSLTSLSTGFLLTVVLAGLAPAASADSSSPEVVATLGTVHRAPAAPWVGAAVTVGQSSGFTSFGKCTGAAPLASTVHASGGGATYTMPFAGVLTSYSTRTRPAAGSVRALAFVDGATNHKTLVGKSSWTPVVINTNNTYAIRVPVPAGAKLGIAVNTNGMFCAIGVGLAGDMLAFATYNPDLSNDMSYGPSTGYRPDISAVLEPDVDGDTFGDVSQDLCPQSGLTQAACPAPDTTVTKAPKKRSNSRQAKIKFTSTTPGATFTCAVDGKRDKPCTSPFKKKYKYGKHQVVVTAVSPVGIADATPVTVKFKVKKPRS